MTEHPRPHRPRYSVTFQPKISSDQQREQRQQKQREREREREVRDTFREAAGWRFGRR
jgi:hypothetical protein